ncbi:MAG: tRNA uridine-5-carboxymethylaminomethyl(34) synthesis GTPase MnmE [Bdellovibrio sp. CG10_big_fil_rev_8_21_14_0_10_47_8]|nr:MAG: tRNA uridine-5-carboxymethylaminomethyl(34) synthesis GTPase MnmE [Bdellovibrio sp. CG10_big_fil_rev_8_21_14_0_10_47_8]
MRNTLQNKDRDLDTICAISTPQGVGGISVIRVSGPEATALTRKICDFFPLKPESHRAYYGHLSDPRTASVVDEVVALYFQKGRSFTAEDTVEISCHGNPSIAREILSLLTSHGGRIADRGEFTYRAFMNGRIDLVQAESVLSLIESQSKAAAMQSLRQLQGDLSDELVKIEDILVWCLAHLEASIDFSSEGIEVVKQSDLETKMGDLKGKIDKLVKSFQQGRLIKDGLKVVLTGIPNVGKSSLLNLLVEEDRAIVTPVPGTTRDVIEASTNVQGLKVNFVDTAGLRVSQDMVEKIGIEKSYLAQRGADAVFFVFDSSNSLSEEELKELADLSESNLYLIGNKRDQGELDIEARRIAVLKQVSQSIFFKDLPGFCDKLKERVLIVSALDKKDGEVIRANLVKRLEVEQFEDQAVLFQARHYEKLSVASRNMERSLVLLRQQASPEFLALEMKEALLSVQDTLGKRFDDDVLDRVFKEFCIGK